MGAGEPADFDGRNQNEYGVHESPPGRPLAAGPAGGPNMGRRGARFVAEGSADRGSHPPGRPRVCCDGCVSYGAGAERGTAHPELRMWKARRCDDGVTAPIVAGRHRLPP